MGVQKIEVVITPDGEVKIEAKGFNGKGCLAATKAFEDALGVAGKRTEKTEIHAPTVGVGQPNKT